MKSLILCILCLVAVSVRAADPAPADPNQGTITLQTAMGTYLQGYAAGPQDAELGILILHDRWGLNETVRAWVERFAARGYRALAIDVFDGRISDKMWLATEIMDATDPESVKVNVNAGLNYLAREREGRKLVTLGAGFGGWQSFQAAVAAPEKVAATVVIYGVLEANVDQVRNLKAPVLTIFARDDEAITAAMMDEYSQLLKKSLIIHRNYVFPAAHGFMDPLHPDYDAAVTEDVWSQVDDFLSGFVEG
jgi:carboxymethylenebutenolidase